MEPQYVICSSDGTLYGPFSPAAKGEEWALKNEELLGDWYGRIVYPPTKEPWVE